MDPTEKRELGRTGVRLTQLGLGGAGFRRSVPRSDVLGALDEAWEQGIRYFDTAPWYGLGMSEHRVGDALQERTGDYVLSTKVGRRLRPRAGHRAGPGDGDDTGFEVQFDYSRDGILRAFEDSRQRLSLPTIDLAIVHDLDLGYHAPAERMDAHLAQLLTSGWPALGELKEAGLIRGIGVGINTLGLIPRFLDLFDVDFFLLASPYTLLEQDALDVELPRCVERGVGIVIGAVFNSGIGATGPVPGARYNYREPTEAERGRAAAVQAVCRRHDVPLAAAALQFPLAHPAVASVIPGALCADHVRRNVEHLRRPIPAALWEELRERGLLREDAPVPAAG